MSTTALFERLAPRYDELWTGTAIGRAQRNAVWRLIDGLFHAGDRVLDIGCGTGEDAAHLMARGISVCAVDSSPAMVAVARARGIEAEVVRAEELGNAPMNRGAADTSGSPPCGWSLASETVSCDGAISNFGALNCVQDVASVARALGTLVRPGGYVAICTIGRFCAWESFYYGVRLNLKKAFRRMPGRAGDVYYPTVRQLRADFAPEFELLHWTGIGMLVPPSYLKLPARIVNFLARFERLTVLRSCADHRLLVFKRK
jgi:SAM-dependent methyltransferase